MDRQQRDYLADVRRRLTGHLEEIGATLKEAVLDAELTALVAERPLE